MTTTIKICGLRDAPSLHAAADAGADYAGFVHYAPSPRHVGLTEAAALKALLPAHVQTVAVLVDPADALLQALEDVLAPHYVQLHGTETPQRVRAIRALLPHTRIIKGLSVRCSDDVAHAGAYSDCADMLLFDAKAPESGMLPGGNGLAFDWALLRGRDFTLPWALSGGLNAENVAQAVALTGAKMVDVSSGVERAPGVKDAALIQAFVKAVRAYDHNA